MWKVSPAISMAKSEQRPEQDRWSPLVTATPACAGTPVSMKLCVETESSRARSVAPPMVTNNCMVEVARGWMPVKAWMEMVGSPSSSSSLTTSMEKSRLHTSRWPATYCSSHLKQRPLMRRLAISAAENFLVKGGRGVSDDAAAAVPEPVGADDVAGQDLEAGRAADLEMGAAVAEGRSVCCS
jgi:ribosomal protein S19